MSGSYVIVLLNNGYVVCNISWLLMFTWAILSGLLL